jgi:hypothetical protein
MHRHTLLLGLVVAVGGAALPSTAAARSHGSHFIAELDGGASLSGDGGLAARLAFGAGGKFRGFPLRFYLLGQLATSRYEAEVPRAVARSGVEEGGFVDLALGPRVYFPITDAWRVYGEALFGASFATGRYAELGRPPLQAQEWLWLAQLTLGVQWRIVYALSLGVHASFAFDEAGLVGVARSAGVHAAVRPSVMGGIAWHF